MGNVSDVMPRGTRGSAFHQTTEREKRLHRVCFTGHRPEKLTRPEHLIKKDLESGIHQAIADGSNVFITGMARGVDIWAAQIVLRLRDDGYDIKLVCALPYDGFDEAWSSPWRKQSMAILSKADLVRTVCQKYSKSCFQLRNKWMVDHSAKVIAVFSGGAGGTKNTIDYAKSKNVPVMFIDG